MIATRVRRRCSTSPGSGGAVDERTALSRELGHFQKSVAEIVDILAGVFPEVGALDDDQTLSYLHSTISTHRHPVRAPEIPMYLDALLPDMPFAPGEVPMLGDHFPRPAVLRDGSGRGR
jgi:hypothetical protein